MIDHQSWIGNYDREQQEITNNQHLISAGKLYNNNLVGGTIC